MASDNLVGTWNQERAWQKKACMCRPQSAARRPGVDWRISCCRLRPVAGNVLPKREIAAFIDRDYPMKPSTPCPQLNQVNTWTSCHWDTGHRTRCNGRARPASHGAALWRSPSEQGLRKVGRSEIWKHREGRHGKARESGRRHAHLGRASVPFISSMVRS
jgi:hypothetical protein